MINEQIAALRARLTRFESGDVNAVLTQGAVDEMVALVGPVPDLSVEPEVCSTVGWLCWYRYLAGSPESDHADLAFALVWLFQVYQSQPESVPEPVREFFDGIPPQAGDTPWVRASQAARFFGDSLTAGRGPKTSASRGANFVSMALSSADPILLTAAIDRLENALIAIPRDNPDHAGYLANLGAALLSRYEILGGRVDLDRAIEVGEAALVASPPGHPDLCSILSNLGTLLQARHELTGRLSDLNRAVEMSKAALAALPSGSSERMGVLDNLATALSHRYDRVGGLDDLNRAVEMSEAALDAAPSDSAGRAGVLANLGTRLRVRYDRLGALADLNRSVDLLQQAVAATPPDSASRAQFMTNLGMAIWRRYTRLHGLADLNLAIEIDEAAVAATPSDSPHRAGVVSNLGLALTSRAKLTKTASDVQIAIAAWKESAGQSTAPATIRAQAAREWGRFAAVVQDWPSAIEGFEAAIGLLARVAPRSMQRSDQEYWLTGFAGLGAEAAACCLQAGRVERAVELLEQGRGVLLGQALDTRTELTQLTEHHPQLATEFVRLRDELNRLNVPDVRKSHTLDTISEGDSDLASQTVESAMIDLRRRAAEQFDQVVAEIRSKPGFAAFLLPVPIRELLPVARHETFALLNVTDIRSDALLLTSDGVQVVPLAEVTPGAVEHHAVQALSMLEVAQDALSGPELRNWAEAEFSRILGWLWDTIASPVLERLGIAASPGGTASPTVAASAAVAEAEALWRLWWCPSGLLTLLPLHAAGHHTTRFDDAPATVLDRVVSSYTPTLRALSQSRRSTRNRSDRTAETPMRYVLVAMPHTPGKPDLPGTVDEANLLRGWFPDAFSVLHGVLRPEEAAHLGLEPTSGLQPDATHERVLAALSGSAWAHFACHAVSDIRNPSASHLLLADYQTHPLTVLDLTGLHLDNADLAYLSACATASTGPHLADESIQLAAALQLAGYRHVIATLWPIADRTAVRVAKDVYSAIADGGVDAAPMALHRSIRRRRNLNPDLPSTWAAHIHTGA